ncbi:MAG: hypothetical protein JSU89_09580 [Myxococcales bacterium]|nr:MAG: hypothetical protein JSU89_09580 [Myxococcales bacterium]
MADKKPETMEEMRLNAAREAWDRHYRPDGYEVAHKTRVRAGSPADAAGWGPVEAREAMRDEGMSEMAAVDDALAAISQPKTLAREGDGQYWRDTDTWETLIPEVGVDELDHLQSMMARGVVKVDPDLERRIQEFEALRKGGEELDYRRHLAEDKARDAVSGHSRTNRAPPLSELQGRATLAEAGGDPLKSQMPTE